jgi:hypothetical protein
MASYLRIQFKTIIILQIIKVEILAEKLLK